MRRLILLSILVVVFFGLQLPACGEDSAGVTSGTTVGESVPRKANMISDFTVTFTIQYNSLTLKQAAEREKIIKEMNPKACEIRTKLNENKQSSGWIIINKQSSGWIIIN